MNSNKSENTSPQQDDIFDLAETIRSLEENAKTLEENVKKQVGLFSKLRVQLNQQFRHNVYQQPQPRSPKPSRVVGRHGRHEHRSQPYPPPYDYTNSLQSLPPQRQPVQSKQNSLQHYTDTLCSPQPSGAVQFGSAEYLQPVLQVTDQYNLQSLPSQQLQPAAQSTGQFVGSHQTVQLEQDGLVTENPSHYTQQLFNPSSTQVTNEFNFTTGQNSPYHHNTHNLSSLKQQAPVPPAQGTDHFMIKGQPYPFDNNEIFDNNDIHRGRNM